jgi:large subunit ribosomal protein L24
MTRKIVNGRRGNGARLHRLSKVCRAPLIDSLAAQYGGGGVRVREGDSVKILRGEYSGVEGKVSKVDAKKTWINVEGVTREKIAGGTTPVKIHPSKVVITTLNLDDKQRKEKLEKRKSAGMSGSGS